MANRGVGMINKNKIFPTIITILIIAIIVYLFVHLDQPTISCKKVKADNLGIIVKENLETHLDNNKISNLKLVKTIILPYKYLREENSYLDYIEYVLKNSYDYLGKDKIEFEKYSDRIIIKIDVKDDETLILNNIEFLDNDQLNIKVNSNTKSSDVISFKVHDNYTQREFITRMRNNGYTCQ